MEFTLLETTYTMGMCDAYAIALHQIYGYPLYVIYGVYKDEDDEENMEPCHIVAKKGNKYLDVRGERTKEELLKNCVFMNKVFKVKFIETSEEEARYIFTSEGVSSADIVKAKKEILKNGI
jgi:hypothetical protein